MKIKQINIEKLRPAEYNPRKISRDMLNSLKRNIKEFGLVDPVVVNKDMTIIGGHQRFKACLELGHKQLPCIVLDLSKPKEKTLNLALNKITGEWDKKKLEILFKDIEALDLGLTGFSDEELEKLIEDIAPDTPEYDIAPRIMEEYNYIVLFFKETLDFQVAADYFGLKMQKEDIRQKVGLGRAIDGAEYLRRMGK